MQGSYWQSQGQEIHNNKAKLGVIEKGAYADLIVVDGNPLKDISVIGGTPKWFDAPKQWKPIDTIKVIVKDGVIYKNTVGTRRQEISSKKLIKKKI